MDYQKIGLKCGLEIHQQLEGKKLFSDCPAYIEQDDAPHTKVIRTLRAVVGEQGVVDDAAQKEQEKAKYYVYRCYPNTCSLVELDEEPPHLMNPHSLMTALQIAKVTQAHIIDEIQVMRKTVVDGSNTSGFQRTALVAVQGSVPSSHGPVRIPTIAIEEDAAKIITRTATYDEYNVSRLGIPLIEIGTDPDIISPEHAQEVAQYLGMILRSTGRVKRGLGTIRQDVNVSIAGGNRIEIKGAQDLQMLPTWVHNEAVRQTRILALKDRFTTQVTPLKEVTMHTKDATSSLLQKAQQVYGMVLPNACGLLGEELMPNYRVGTDIADVCKVLVGIGGIVHSDEPFSKYGMKDTQQLYKALGATQKDAVILLVCAKEVAQKAREVIIQRLQQLSQGVPKEVRKANENGTTSYLRPMPGSARMYPETDTIPLQVHDWDIQVPELLTQKSERYQQAYSLAKDLADALVWSSSWDVFEHVVKVSSLKPASVAEQLISVPVMLKRKHNIERNITKEEWLLVFEALAQQTITSTVIVDIFAKQTHLGDAIASYSVADEATTKKIVEQVVAQHAGKTKGALFGLIMKQGTFDGKLVNTLLDELL
ncbi:MAG: Glu-tRNA(Gln) amidotransferase subunit GatE [Candidatus Woesearchaeota archaeon]